MALYSTAAGDIALITMFGRFNDQLILNTFHYKVTSVGAWPDGPAAMASLMTWFKDQIWTTEWKPTVSTEYKLEALQAQIIYPIRRVFERQVINEFGGQVDNALPSFCTCCITRFGSIAGRGRSASLQICGLTESQVNESVINDAAIASYQGIADMLDVNPTNVDNIADGYNPVNWTIAKAAETNIIRSAQVRREVRTEKRRVVGRGV